MQTMELVNIEDVYPYEENDVRMNPRDVESKECREYIAQLAEQFRYNRLNPGQPRVRPILYRDGGIYQIIDGECRYEAMKLIGTKKFYADVYDDLDDAETARQEAAKAMVETDAKRALTAEEMSRGVQQMLALDLPDEEVAAVARIDAGKVGRARRGARVVSDAAYDMTLDRLAAIAEFEGDEEAVAKLRDCTQKEWARVYEGLRAERERRRAMDEMTEAARAAGVTIAERTPEGYVAKQTFSAYNRAAFDRHLEAGCEGEIAVVSDYGLTFLSPAAAGAEVDEGRQREEQERSDFYAAFEDARRARAAWIGSHIGDVTSMRKTARLLTCKALTSREVGGFEEVSGAKVESAPCPLAVALGYQSLQGVTAFGVWNAHRHGDGSYLYGSAARDTLDLLDAMAADGYGLHDAEEKTAAACRITIEEESDEQ
ncbi:ParB N-terminal domain-containing protein [Olsenella sp. An188]|uniref:ParB N-terminal domain-containing protein n=1 Tax=Olsenella sp. An188 TaxID=1965579 RepID=UPI000B38700C|nr:ParB N-terminal domain-containing protein [Olsenella sp. An188]OUP37942.1 hypothetical protein B5F23_08275 [Olsenella sp. An188]